MSLHSDVIVQTVAVFAGALCDGTTDEGVLVPGSCRSPLRTPHPQNSAETRTSRRLQGVDQGRKTLGFLKKKNCFFLGFSALTKLGTNFKAHEEHPIHHSPCSIVFVE